MIRCDSLFMASARGSEYILRSRSGCRRRCAASRLRRGGTGAPTSQIGAEHAAGPGQCRLNSALARSGTNMPIGPSFHASPSLQPAGQAVLPARTLPGESSAPRAIVSRARSSSVSAPNDPLVALQQHRVALIGPAAGADMRCRIISALLDADCRRAVEIQAQGAPSSAARAKWMALVTT